MALKLFFNSNRKYYSGFIMALTILISITLIAANGKDKNYGFIVLLGPTRAGKSCFINTITGSDLTIVGDDSGDSTTKTSTLYEARIDGFPEKKQYFLIDTMGLDDSEDSQFADNIIFANTTLLIKDLMKTHDKRIDAFLIFESLTNDSNQLGKTLKKLKAVFGEEIKDNSLVIFNKNPNPNPRRMNRLQETAGKHGVKHVHWKSGCITDNGKLADNYYQQMEELHNLILSAESLGHDDISTLIDVLVKEGKEVYSANQQIINRRVKILLTLGGVGLYALSALNIPLWVAYNIAVITTDELLQYLRTNETFYVSLAIEERIKSKFTKSDL